MLSAFFAEAPGTPIAVGTHPEEIVVGDFNGDGILDLATANSGGIATPPRGDVSVLLGDGDGTFTEAPGSPIAIGSPAWTLVATDLDEDGNLELIVGARTGDHRGVTVLMGRGDGTFARPAESPISDDWDVNKLATADVNGDGNVDLMVAHGGGLAVLLGDGAGGVTQAPTYPEALGFVDNVIAGDFDGDGLDDLVVVQPAIVNLKVLLSNGNGTFREAPDSPVFSSGGEAGFAGDLDRDGITDFVINQTTSTTFRTFLGFGDGTFNRAVYSSNVVEGRPYQLDYADLNGNGDYDLVAGNLDSGRLAVLMGQGDGRFFEAANSGYEVGERARAVAIGDFNGDDRPDVVVSGEESVTVMLNVPLEMSIDDVTTQEGDDGTTAFNFTVSLNFDPGVPVSVDFATVAGSAIGGVDYEEVAGTITFDGTTTRTITVPVFGNVEEQEDRGFFVNLSDPRVEDGALISLAKDQGVGTILDDESTIRFSVDQITVGEGQDRVIRVVRTGDGALTRGASARVVVGGRTGDSATRGDDFVTDFEGYSTLLTFWPGETVKEFTLSAIADGRFEPEEGFAIVLEEVEGANPGASNVLDMTIPGTVVTVGPVEPDPTREPVSGIAVTFSEAIDPSTFSLEDVMLSRFGRPVSLADGVTIGAVDGSNTRFVVGGLAGLTGAKGPYEFEVDLEGIADPFGGSLGGSVASAFAVRPDIAADFDGDGISDVAVYTFDEEAGTGRFEVRASSTDELMTFDLGVEGDVPVVGDFDGDGKADFAVYGFDPSAGHSRFLIHHSSTGETARLDFGGQDDAPVAGDFDGDGITDLAVFGYSPDDGFTRFAILHSGGAPIVPTGGGATPIGAVPLEFGGESDVSVVGDYDGDGIADLAVYEYDPVAEVARYAILHSAGGPIVPSAAGATPSGGFSIAFGGINDVPVVGDFDGDGIADLVVFGDSPDDGASRYAVLQSGGSPIFGNKGAAPSGAFLVAFGEGGDRPIGGDFDGDGRTDLAVFGSGRFAIRPGISGEDRVITFGGEGDVPLPPSPRLDETGGRVPPSAEATAARRGASSDRWEAVDRALDGLGGEA